ncbi:MAG: GyrI-like domain-containing protein [Gemmataceae bacterium]|nr:GyrI-like domain-containing protein [Gemmataceae bacterium]
MVMVKATKSSEAAVMPTADLVSAMQQFNEELIRSGILLAGEGLQPSAKGVRVRFSGDSRVVTTGPFAETSELVAGYWLWKVKDMDEAIAWVKRCPNPMLEDSDIEIRPLFGIEDFGDVVTPDVREKDAALRAITCGLNEPRYETGREILVGGILASYTQGNIGEIPGQWQQFKSIGPIPGQIGSDSFGVSLNCKADCSFDYLVGVEFDGDARLPAGFTTTRIPAGRYVVVPHTAPVSQIKETYDAIWSRWIPESGLKLASAPMFERYTKDYNPQTGTGGIEIWIAVQG